MCGAVPKQAGAQFHFTRHLRSAPRSRSWVFMVEFFFLSQLQTDLKPFNGSKGTPDLPFSSCSFCRPAAALMPARGAGEELIAVSPGSRSGYVLPTELLAHCPGAAPAPAARPGTGQRPPLPAPTPGGWKSLGQGEQPGPGLRCLTAESLLLH